MIFPVTLRGYMSG